MHAEKFIFIKRVKRLSISVSMVTLYLALASCQLHGNDLIKNLKFDSVAVVNSTKERDLAWLNAKDGSDSQYIRINFSAETDIFALERSGFNIGMDAYYCPEKQVDRRQPLWSTRDIDGVNGGYRYRDEESDSMTMNSPYLYHGYIQFPPDPTRKVGTPDIRKFTDSVCLVITGGMMIGVSYESMPIYVPLSAIEEAIKVNATK